jgi:hypothetical protein
MTYDSAASEAAKQCLTLATGEIGKLRVNREVAGRLQILTA